MSDITPAQWLDFAWCVVPQLGLLVGAGIGYLLYWREAKRENGGGSGG